MLQRRFTALTLALILVTGTAFADCGPAGRPPASLELGFSKLVLDECPTASDISPDGSGLHKLYSGQWYARSIPSGEHYSTRDGVLTISLGGDLVSISRDFERHQLPLLSGAKGFYVEFEARLSDNDPDHWPALWLMPVEHDGRQRDRYEGDPPGHERWMELDVDEGGFGPSMHGTLHSWQGVAKQYRRQQSRWRGSRAPLDRTQYHTFAAAFDPQRAEVRWWLDGRLQNVAGSDYISSAATRQNFYLIMGAQSHGAHKPYQMQVRRVRAFVRPY